MRQSEFSLEEILAELQSNNSIADPDVWEPGFAGERQVVYARLGPFVRCYAKPCKFIKRFYHRLYPLPIEDWQITARKQLFGGFCTIDATLDLRFQASHQFAIANMESLAEINPFIKHRFKELILDVLDRDLHNLELTDWVQTGLNDTEKQIETAINEALIAQKIQCRALCRLKSRFEELSDDLELDDRFIHKSIYIEVMRKNFACREHQKQESFRQEELLRQQQLEHKQKLLDQIDKEGELLSIKQEKEANNLKRQLVEKERQKDEVHVIERRLHARELAHNNFLMEMEVEAETQNQEKKQALQQQAEKKILDSKLEHDTLIKEKELEFEIKEFEKHQKTWSEAEAVVQEEKLKRSVIQKEKELESEILDQEIRMVAQQKLEERLQEEKLRHESRLREMELDAEQHEKQKRYETTRKSDQFLQREIELLVLEKQKAELHKEIKFAEDEAASD